MANHVDIKTKTKMTPAKVTTVLRQLNNDVFKDCLTIEYRDTQGNNQAWGPHVWLVKARGNKNWDTVCWLNNSKNFELRHGRGGEFLWWVELLICNQIGLEFDGKIEDDGPVPVVENLYPQFINYLLSMVGNLMSTSCSLKRIEKIWRIQKYEQSAPPEFRRPWRYHCKERFRKDMQIEIELIKNFPKKIVD